MTELRRNSAQQAEFQFPCQQALDAALPLTLGGDWRTEIIFGDGKERRGYRDEIEGVASDVKAVYSTILSNAATYTTHMELVSCVLLFE